MRPLPLQRLLVAVLALLPLFAQADPIGYAVGFSDLYRLDVANGQASRVGAIGFNDVEGLALAPDGALYGVADATMALPGNNNSATTDFLLRVDRNTGVGTLIGQLPGLQQPAPNDQLDYGLAFTCDGRLWMSSDTTGQLWEVDPLTAAVRLVGTMGAPISGLAGNAQGLYGVSVEPGGVLYRIDTQNASLARVGAMGLSDRMYDAGADFDAQGRLWVTVDYFSPPSGLPPLRNDLAEVNVATGQVISLRPISGAGTGINTVQIEGFALASVPPCNSGGVGGPAAGPIPVPATGHWALVLLAGLLGLMAWRARP